MLGMSGRNVVCNGGDLGFQSHLGVVDEDALLPSRFGDSAQIWVEVNGIRRWMRSATDMHLTGDRSELAPLDPKNLIPHRTGNGRLIDMFPAPSKQKPARWTGFQREISTGSKVGGREEFKIVEAVVLFSAGRQCPDLKEIKPFQQNWKVSDGFQISGGLPFELRPRAPASREAGQQSLEMFV